MQHIQRERESLIQTQDMKTVGPDCQFPSGLSSMGSHTILPQGSPFTAGVSISTWHGSIRSLYYLPWVSLQVSAEAGAGAQRQVAPSLSLGRLLSHTHVPEACWLWAIGEPQGTQTPSYNYHFYGSMCLGWFNPKPTSLGGSVR